MKILGKIGPFFLFLCYYVKQVFASNLRIARDVLTPGSRIRPGFISVPLRTRTDTELLAFANLITMTPGTLSVDVATDRSRLYVHVIYLDDEERMRKVIDEGLQTRILEILR